MGGMGNMEGREANIENKYFDIFLFHVVLLHNTLY